MNSDSNFSFSPDLQTTFDIVKGSISSYQARLDQISADIRKLEAFLQHSNYGISTRLSVRSWTQTESDSVDFELGFHGKEWSFSEYLHWDKEGEKYRLVYELERQEGYVEVAEGLILARGLIGRAAVVERKPFVDCKASKRIELAPKLNDFLLEIAKTIDPVVRAEEDRSVFNAFEELLTYNSEQSRKMKERGVRPVTQEEWKKAHEIMGGIPRDSKV